MAPAEPQLTCLVKAIGELPEREQLIVALYYYVHLTLVEIAGILNMTEERVSMVMNKALTEMQEKLNTGAEQ